MTEKLGPIETIKLLRETLGIDLGTAKMMVHAQRSRNLGRELTGMRDLVVEMRSLLLEVAQGGYLDPPPGADLEKRVWNVVTETEEFDSKGLKGNGWSNDYHAQRVAELELRCKEHRAKRAELQREIDRRNEA